MIVAPRRLTSAVQLLPAALLFAGLVLGGPGLAKDASTPLEAIRCYQLPNGHEYCVEEPDDPVFGGRDGGVYVPTGGFEGVLLEG